MSERGIIFSGPMVCSLLDDKKSQTRRLLSLRGYRDFSEFGASNTPGFDWHFRRADGCWCDFTHQELLKLLPHAVGDRLYVREAWTAQFWNPDDIDGPPLELWETPRSQRTRDFLANQYYRCTEEQKEPILRFAPEGQWTPSIHMPRWASRLTLTITDIRVQKLRDIGRKDAISEGLVWRNDLDAWSASTDRNWPTFSDPVRSFAGLWDSLHASGKQWDDNPWLYALTFNVQHGNIDQVAAL